MGEDCFHVVFFIVLDILTYQISGYAHSFPHLNKVGFSVIDFLWTVFRKSTKGKCPWFKRSMMVSFY